MISTTARCLASAWCFTLLLVLVAVGARAAAGDASVPWPTRGWAQSTPAAFGLSDTTLAALDADLSSGKYGLVDSVQVFRCGIQAYSRNYAHDYAAIYAKDAARPGPLNARGTGEYNYFDPHWHPYYKGTDLHTMQSVTKTVTSVIFGIAITRGDFKAGLDTPVLHWFGEKAVKNVDARKRRLTLKHVLTMTTGLEWNETVPYDDPRNDADRMEATNDWIHFVIDKPMIEEPGTHFNYSSGASALLAQIFRLETGQDMDSYAQAHLFGPLGMRHHWKHPYGDLVDTEGGLYLSGSDLAKIGYLFLNDGMWAGKRLVSHDWVSASLTPFVDTDWQGLKYGYKWWLQPLADGHELVWHAIGFAGQRLIVFPAEQLIATFTAWDIYKDPDVDSELALRVLAAMPKSDKHTDCGAIARGADPAQRSTVRTSQ